MTKMRTGNRRQGRSNKTSGTPPEGESNSAKGKGRPSGRPKREGGYSSARGKSTGDRPARKPYGERPYSSGAGGRKKSFGSPSGRFQKDKPSFNKTDRSDKPRFGREGGSGRPPFRNDRDADNSRFRKDGDSTSTTKGSGYSKPFQKDGDRNEGRFRKDGDKTSGGRNSGYSKPFQKDGDRSRGHFRKDDNRTSDNRSSGFRKPFENKSDPGEERKWNRKEKHEFYGDRKRKFSKKPFRKPNPQDTPLPGGEAGGEADGTIRLNKYISNAGICSRREADELIAAGVISVNGNVITTLGYKVQPGDVVKYNDAKLKSEKPVYLLLNKPKDFITTVDDPQNRNTVMSLIRNACKERVYPVGRLDRNTTGLLLFTNDGDLADKLTHPSFEIQKVYEVHLDKNLRREDFEAISEGVQLEDGLIRPDEISYSSESKSVIGIELHSGRNRIVRRIFEHLGYRVVKLDRVLYAGLTKKDLPRSKWRFLTDIELANLKMMTGNKKFKAAPKRISLAEE